MRVAIYARVSSESQEARGTIGSQLEVLRQRVATEGHELVAEYCDDGCSGARLDRPGLDQLRDAAEAGQLDAEWCLPPDRLARMYAYQVIVLDELSRHGVSVRFHDTPALNDDPQSHLLTQVQGVIAEYERAKMAKRYRRGKLWRARAGEVLTWKCAYGYRRLPRCAERAAHLEVYEPEAAIVRRIFRDYVQSNWSIRQITRQLNQDGVASPSGVEGFAEKVKATIDHLDFDQRQKLLRLVIDKVRVQGWQIEIKLRIPLESPPEPPGTGSSIKDRLRSLHGGGGSAPAAPRRRSDRSTPRG